MEAILKFKLPEEKAEFNFAAKGIKYYSTLTDIEAFIRQKIKYEEVPEDHAKLLEEIRNIIEQNCGLLEDDL